MVGFIKKLWFRIKGDRNHYGAIIKKKIEEGDYQVVHLKDF